MDWPEHSHCQHSSYNQCERDIQILAHVNRLYAQGAEHKEKLSFVRFAVKAKGVLHQGLGGSDKVIIRADANDVSEGECENWMKKIIRRA